MSPEISLTIVALVGYLLGALPFGYVVARAHGIDIFKVGSGNPGATNVKRVLGERFGAKGRRAGNLVFVLDAVKGALAAAPYMQFFAAAPEGAPAGYFTNLQIAGLIAAVLGHSFSVFTKFKGGKGVATAAGGVLVLMPVACLAGGLTWVVTFYASRYVSLGSIIAAVVVPVIGWLTSDSVPLNIVVTLLGLFVVVRHRENIRRLIAGTENKFTRKPAAPPQDPAAGPRA